VVWHLSRFESPASSLKGLGSIFGDHFSPALTVFAPLYWIWPSPNALLVAQAALVSASAVPLYAFAARRLPQTDALLLTVAYLLFGGVQEALWFDWHEVCLAPLLIASAVALADRCHWARATACVLGLLLVKEDLAFLVIAFGLVFAVMGQRRMGGTLAVVGAVWFWVVTEYVIPGAAGGRDFAYWSYERLGSGPLDALAGIVTNPFAAVDVGLSPSVKIRTLLFSFGAFLFLSLRSRYGLLAIPLLAERMLSSNPKYWTLNDHYSLTLAPVLALAAADGLARLRDRRPRLRVLRPAAPVMAAMAMASVAVFPLGQLFRADSWHAADGYQDAGELVRRVPQAAELTASNRLVPHLTHRAVVDLPSLEHAPREWVLMATADRSAAGLFPVPDTQARMRLLERLGLTYVEVARAPGVVLLRTRSSGGSFVPPG
jgi:uncharacterized membrane protein